MRLLRILFAVIAVAAVASSALARTEPNSFLNRPAYTKAELEDQIRTDSVVADRYMRHFGMTKDEVIQMVDGLTLDRLQEDGVYLVYNVPKWEEVRQRALYYKKGTLVWKDKTGEPVLKASCGNPLVRGTDIGVAQVAPEFAVSPVDQQRSLIAVKEPTTIPTSMPAEAMAPAGMEANAAELAPIAPALPVVHAPSFNVVNVLPFLVAIGIGGSSSHEQTVPELGPLAVFGGLCAVGLLSRRRHS